MRPPDEQIIHDKVLHNSAKSYLKITTQENIKTNPNDSKKFQIEGQYPDIIIKLPTGEIILEEIETESTVNEQSQKQWQQLSNLGHEVRVIVPLSKLDLAKELVSRLTIPILIQAYNIVDDKIHWFGKNK